MKLDFSGVEEFVPVPEGRYLAEITKSAEGMSQRSNQRKWGLTLEVREDPQHDDEYVGKTIKWDISLTKNARWKVLQVLQALGEEVSREDIDFEFDATNFIGRMATMVVGMQNDATYGQRSRVLRLEPADALVAIEA